MSTAGKLVEVKGLSRRAEAFKIGAKRGDHFFARSELGLDSQGGNFDTRGARSNRRPRCSAGYSRCIRSAASRLRQS
jgi:hypothetical protein